MDLHYSERVKLWCCGV